MRLKMWVKRNMIASICLGFIFLVTCGYTITTLNITLTRNSPSDVAIFPEDTNIANAIFLVHPDYSNNVRYRKFNTLASAVTEAVKTQYTGHKWIYVYDNAQDNRVYGTNDTSAVQVADGYIVTAEIAVTADNIHIIGVRSHGSSELPRVHINSASASAFDVTGDGFSISGITFSHGQVATSLSEGDIIIRANQATIKDCHWKGASTGVGGTTAASYNIAINTMASLNSLLIEGCSFVPAQVATGSIVGYIPCSINVGCGGKTADNIVITDCDFQTIASGYAIIDSDCDGTETGDITNLHISGNRFAGAANLAQSGNDSFSAAVTTATANPTQFIKLNCDGSRVEYVVIRDAEYILPRAADTLIDFNSGTGIYHLMGPFKRFSAGVGGTTQNYELTETEASIVTE